MRHEANSPLLQSEARREMIAASGALFQLIGLPRSTGQIYGLLYLSPRPLALDDLAAVLSISKGSASTGTRHLVFLGAIRQVWIPGERRDFFEVIGDLAGILRATYREFFLPRLSSSEKRLASIVEGLEKDAAGGAVSIEDYHFCAGRLKALLQFQEQIQSIGPLAETVFHKSL